jgi:hypothetical protein
MKFYLFILTCFILYSCEEEITLNLPQAEDKLVVEGFIEPGFPPYITISKNEGYFDPISSSYPSNIYIDNVDSIVVWYYSDDGTKISKELKIISDLESIRPIYSVDDYDFIMGNSNYDFSREKETYYLQINWNNKVITAETYIPESTPLDCLWVKQSETADKDFKCDIRAWYSDPIDRQNNILIKSKRIVHYNFNQDSCSTKNKPDFPLQLVDAGSDILVNGESFETFFPRPKEGSGFPSGAYNSKHEMECNNGNTLDIPQDVVLIKFCQIDEPSMKFWRGVRRQTGRNGNPFAEPLNLVSNINGGLGAWTGYSPKYYIVPITVDTVIFEEVGSNLKVLDIL